MATSGPVEIADLAERVKMAPTTLEKHLLALEAKGLIFRGHFTPRRPALGAPRERATRGGGVAASPEQWCDRYNLEKIHRLTLNRLRSETEPAADHEYAAFRLRWSHLGGAGIAADQSGVAAVLEQLSGVALSPELWERAILPARIPGYRPEWLDLLCLGGEVVWAAVPAQADTDDEVPARITFLRRRRAGAARVDAENSAAAADAAAAEFTDGDERRVFLALAAGGAQYLDQLAERAGLAERTALAALWRLAAAGRVSNDSFAPLRLLWAAPEAVRAMAPGPHRRARHDAALRARLRSSVTGRWSALGVEAATQTAAPPPGAAIATPPGGGQSRSGARAPERDAARDRGQGFGARARRDAAQAQRYRDARDARARERADGVARNFVRASPDGVRRSDPARLFRSRAVGRAVCAARRARDACRVAQAQPRARASAGAQRCRSGQSLRRGAAGMRRRARGWQLRRSCGADARCSGSRGARWSASMPSTTQAFSAAVGALTDLRRKVVVETIDGAAALGSVRVGAMAAMGFHSDGRALVYDGLPGPAPSRASVRRQAK